MRAVSRVMSQELGPFIYFDVIYSELHRTQEIVVKVRDFNCLVHF